MRVIADLVVNHTSDEHPWFQEARSQPGLALPRLVRLAGRAAADGPRASSSPTRRTASGSSTRRPASTTCNSFYKFQPDLNIANPEVRDEIARILGFWMELGLSGFRVDAVPFLIETRAGVAATARPARVPRRPARLPEPPRRHRDPARRGQPALRGPDGVLRRRGDGDELTMCFDFIAMQRFYLSLARGDPGPSPRPCASGPSRPTTPSGRRSSATTTS